MTGVSRFIDKPVKATWLARLGAQEDLNFLLTNRVPRLALTRLMGRISRIRSPRFTALAIWIWRHFTDLDLSEARQDRFDSIHDCFTRELKPGARPIDFRESVWSSPCDALMGAHGRIESGLVLQAKGMPYRLEDLVGPSVDLSPFSGGHYTTLRLTSGMYHRFHAPCDLHLEHVTYISGDTWNVNPIALQRIERLFCRNERAVLRVRTPSGTPLLIIPVAAVLVASMRLHALDVRLHLRYRGPNEFSADAHYSRGTEMGWFEHGSTIIVITPPGYALLDNLPGGSQIRMGQALWSAGPAAPQ
jgi:phosphatidylserine decarboxylase